MAAVKINRKIVAYSVVKEDEAPAAEAPADADPVQATERPAEQPAEQQAGESGIPRVLRKEVPRKSDDNVIHMHEKVERPEVLIGSTYKVKTPVSDHAMYVTINDIVLNKGTQFESRRPFEVFINSKNLDHYQWIVALTRIISAVFRKGGDVTFLVDELKAVFDPRGGYWKPGGKYMPSIIAELGHVVEQHLQTIGMLKTTELDEHQQKLIDQKRAEYDEANRQTDAFADSEFPEGAQLCSRCSTAAVVMMDGCMTCLSCGDSKCG